jgi:polyhydroxyalkanoate synthase
VAPVDVDAVIDGDGLIPVSAMKPVFALLDPMGNWSKFEGVDAASEDTEKLRRVMVRERWLEENVPMSGAFAREFLAHTYQGDDLLDGAWVIRGEAVRLADVRCPTLVVACNKDFITPMEAARPLADAVGGPVRLEVLDTGHIGVVVGAMGPKTFYPLLDRWFRERT